MARTNIETVLRRIRGSKRTIPMREREVLDISALRRKYQKQQPGTQQQAGLNVNHPSEAAVAAAEACNVMSRVGSNSNTSQGCCDLQVGFPRVALDDQDLTDCSPACATPAEIASIACADDDIVPAVFVQPAGLFSLARQDHPLGLRDRGQLKYCVRLLSMGRPTSPTYTPLPDGVDQLFTITPPASDADPAIFVNQLHLGVMLVFGGSIDETSLGSNIKVTVGPSDRVPSSVADVPPVAFSPDQEINTISRFFSGDIEIQKGKLLIMFADTRVTQSISQVTIGTFPPVGEGGAPGAYNVRVVGLPTGMTVSAELITHQSGAMFHIASRFGKMR